LAPAAGPRRHRGQERRARAADENEETKEDFEWRLRESRALSPRRRQGGASGPIMFTDGFDERRNGGRECAACDGHERDLPNLSLPKTPSIWLAVSDESEHDCRMIAIGLLFVRMLCDCFKPRQQLEAEIMVLRHQLNVLQQQAPRRLHLRWTDRALFIWPYRRCPRILDAITIVRPETVLRWHRMDFAAYWRWKSRSLGGRPRIPKEVRDLIRRMSLENPFWGATKIHGELLKLGARSPARESAHGCLCVVD
jgi:hypothetical protein